jgi:hypothetical protein
MRITSTDYERPHRPLALRLVNAAGRALERAGHEGASLERDSLIEAARRRTGLANFGDPAFRRPLEVLLASMEHGADLHPAGRLMARQNLIRILANRLRIENTIHNHPGILETPMQDPVIITGLQRTGTTLLNRLLGIDPALRWLRSWEAVNPAPWHEEGDRDPRIRAARLAQASVRWLAPDFFAIHPVDAESSEEDVLLFEYALVSQVPEATMKVPTYSRWLEREADWKAAYRYYERVLRVLAWQRPVGRWLLKSPQHLEHLDVLLDVFPDARVLVTHRDPTRCQASFCSMMAHAWGIFTDAIDPHEVGRHWGSKQVRMVERAMAARDAAPADRFLDILYADLVSDPVGQAQRALDFLGMDLDPEVERGMRRHLEDNPRRRHGRHRYALEDFGLERQEVDARFAAYRDRFRVPAEGEDR